MVLHGLISLKLSGRRKFMLEGKRKRERERVCVIVGVCVCVGARESV